MIVFPFTTELLGLGIGFAFMIIKKEPLLQHFSALSMTTGISLLLYVFRFPVLGPSISREFDIVMVAMISPAQSLSFCIFCWQG
ncbi:MAG: hypothetical protein ABFD25_04800 [Clostridiaceae bacterium]